MALTMLAACVVLVPPAAGRVIYVDDDAVGSNNGSSWKNAFLCLQDALSIATSGDDIRVAQGIYKPDQHIVKNRVTGSGDRSATFRLINGVTLRGGYAGFAESNPNQRNTQRYGSILSGDLRGDDIPVDDLSELASEHRWWNNCAHVVTCHEVDQTAWIEGFTITGGYADYRADSRGGGGVLCLSASPTVSNCKFIANRA
ncbi:MAG: hypothetical protein JSW27_00585, partial [Phycisphaerales bacterium]